MKDSFDDRVCDDLSEVLLQYLSLEDKLKLQCVSKQFQRTIFRRHHHIVINQNMGKMSSDNIRLFLEIKCKRLAIILKKVVNVNKITFSGYHFIKNMNEVMKTIINCCNQLSSLVLICNSDPIKSSTVDNFNKKFGKQLKNIEFGSGVYTKYEPLLANCPNMVSITNTPLYRLTQNSPINVPKVAKVRVVDIEGFESFVGIFGRKVTHLSINFGFPRDTNLINCLSQLEALQELELTTSGQLSIARIVSKCHQMRNLRINGFDFKNIGENDFKCMTNLRRLTLFSVNSIENMEIDIKSLEFCPQLTHLTLKYFIPDFEFFDTMDKIVPNLRHLEIHTKKDLNRFQWKCISKLKNLKHLIIRSKYDLKVSPKAQMSIKSILISCKRLQTIRFENYGISSEFLKNIKEYDSLNLFSFPENNFSRCDLPIY